MTSTTGSASTSTTDNEEDEASTSSSAGGEADLPGSTTTGSPERAAVDMPGEVAAAGPVIFTVTTEHTTTARASVDGVDLGVLDSLGGGVLHDGSSLMGSLPARDVYEVELEPFSLAIPAGPSEALDVTVDAFGRIFGAGLGSPTQGRLFHVHP